MCHQYDVLNTTDKNGQEYQFVYGPPEEDTAPGETYDDCRRTVTYFIKTKPEADRFYEFTVQEEGNNRLKVIMMNNHGRDEYKAKSISEGMIQLLARTSGKTVTSSSNKAGPGEYRTEPASKVWKHLVDKGLARYDADEDRYYALAANQ